MTKSTFETPTANSPATTVDYKIVESQKSRDGELPAGCRRCEKYEEAGTLECS